MANDAYTILLKFDDSEFNKQLDRMKSLSSKMGGGSDSNGGDSPMKQLLKLGAIATGITGILVLVKKLTSAVVASSPNLQAILDILNTSFSLVLRPIGDFIAMTLRPIMISLLRNVIIPFYKSAGPQAIQTGIEFGNNLDRIAFQGDFEFAMENATNNLNVIGGEFFDFGKFLHDNIMGGLKAIGEQLGSFQLIPAAYADSGPSNPVVKELNIFEQVIAEAHRRIVDYIETYDERSTGTGGLAGEARGDRGNKSGKKKLSMSAYNKMVERRGLEWTERYMERRGYELESTGSSSGGGNRGSGRSNSVFNINIKTDSRLDSEFKQNIERVVQEEVKKQERNWANRPGRR